MNSYLLGKLTEEEAARFEAEWFDDDTRYAEFQSAQDDLFDAYAANRLSATDRELFERHLLASPFLRQRAEFAQTLAVTAQSPGFSRNQSTGEIQPLKSGTTSAQKLKEFLWPSGWRLGFAAAMLLIAFGGGWLFKEIRQLRNQVKQTESLLAAETERFDKERERTVQMVAELEIEKARVAQLEAEKQTQPANALASIFSFVLTPLALRDGANLPRLNIPANAQTIQLRLRFDNQQTFNEFAVQIETIEGVIIWSKNRLSANGRQLILALPAQLLPHNDYLVKLLGRAADGQRQEIANYQMRIIRQ
ncbi:MAG: hypothetical protein SF097_08470 [Acidobacteriota bacterium]|nr:hypothetical protein [Acidobacteriota bacterium]